jgi:pimeloyl-ACP methyl ester carboxylesterase
VTREDVWFLSAGQRCAAWWYPGESGTGIVMAHGFAGTRGARLDAYAERFQEAGHSVLLFDYRHFGDSEGEPRQLLSNRRQLADWRAALGYVRAREDVERVVLWGTSLSGGHVIETAAREPGLAAVIAQTPMTDGIASVSAQGAKALARMTGAALRDAARALTRREPLLMPAVAAPGALGAMTTPDAQPGYLAIAPPGWRNEVTPRMALSFGAYRPGRKAAKVVCPLLVQVATDDAITPPEPSRKAAARAPHATLVEYEGGHFDIYVPPLFERAVADQIHFLDRHLTGARAADKVAT